MATQNKHGLGRNIPEAVRRAVRRRCGFGCVFCGRAIVQYHHFDPPYESAVEHRAGGITLLCGTCHDKAGKGLISRTAVEAADRNPVCRKQGFTRDDLLFEQKSPYVRFANSDFYCRYPIVYGNEAIIGFEEPEDPDGPLRLQASLYGPTGEKMLEIVNNEWRAGADLFDVVTVGNRLEIREMRGTVAVGFEFCSNSGLHLMELDMAFRDCRVVFKDDWVSAERGGSVLQLKAGRIQGDAGVFFPSEGGVVMGASNMILAPNIERFAARNELERALTHVRDGRAAMQRFATLLAQCHVYVLSANMRHGDRFVKVQDLAVDGGDPAMAVLTCVARIGPLLRRVPSIGNPVLVPFPALLASSPPPRFIWFNPFSPVAPRIPASMLSRGPNSQ